MAFLVLTYLPYTFAVIVCGFGLHWGLFNGEHPFTLTFVPAVIGCIALAIALAIAFVPTDLQRRIAPFAARHGRFARLVQKLSQAPASTSAGVRDALEHLRSRDPALLGAILFWAFQIAVLWAAFHAFGDAPPVAVLIQAFFVGMLGNLLPMPGRRRRRGGRDDRRLRRVRRQQRTGRRRRARLPCVHLLAAAAAGRDRVLPAP